MMVSALGVLVPPHQYLSYTVSACLCHALLMPLTSERQVIVCLTSMGCNEGLADAVILLHGRHWLMPAHGPWRSHATEAHSARCLFIYDVIGCIAGLADGVGSWIESGVDAGIFARELMGNCESAAKQIAPSKTAPMNILKNGFYDTKKMVCIWSLAFAYPIPIRILPSLHYMGIAWLL